MDEKVLKKLYIEETLKKRKYIGYRLDIALLKSILTIIIFAIVYYYSKNIIFSLIVGFQIFLLFTLLNKVKINRKVKVGKDKLLQRIKLKKFKNKIFYSDYNDIESFIMLYLNQYRYKNIKKTKKYSYSAIKDSESTNIYIMKFFEDAIVEKADIRNLLTVILNRKTNRNLLFILNDMSEEASELLEKHKDKLKIQTICLNDIYKFADESMLLSETYESNDIEDLERKVNRKTKDVFKNVFVNKKLIIYIIAAILFYAIHKTIFPNQLGIYISYYFIILACINVLYRLYVFYTRINENKKQTN
jgi:hypothetical protein